MITTFNEAWSNHDLDRAISMLTEDCVFEATGPAPDGNRATGHAEIRVAWKPIFDDLSSRFETEEMIAFGDRVVVRWRYSWDGGHVRGVDVSRVRDGLVAEKLAYVKG